MLKKIRNNTLQALVIGLIAAPILINGQDLGSSNGLFRAPNPPTKSSSEKRAKTKKAPTRSATRKETARAARRNALLAARRERVAAQRAAAAKAKNLNNNQIGETIIITVGGKKRVEKVDVVFDSAIDKGNLARDARNYKLAETSYRYAQTLKPNDPRPIYGLGNLFSDQQRWEEAEKAYRSALELDQNNPDVLIALSFILTQPIAGPNLMERYAEAEKSARRAIELDPTNPFAYDQLGVALEYRGVINKETQNAYRKAVELDPSFALAYAHLGRLLRRIGLNDASSAAYGDAIRMANDVPTMILVADVMQSQQRYTESEQLLRRALKSDPKNPTALYLLGRAMTTRGEFSEAERLLKTSVEVSPNSFITYTQLASLYLRGNNFAEAEKTLMKALKIVSENDKKRLAQQFEFVGDGFMRSGRKKDAARVYQQAIELDAEKASLPAKLQDAQKS